MSLNAAQYHPRVAVTAVELLPGIQPLMEHFGTHPEQNHWQIPPRWVTSDARRFVAADNNQYDVIIADLFHPAREGAASLYTLEHFGAVRERLQDDGLFVQWLPLFQMDLNTFRQIAGAFVQAYPHVQVHLPHFSLHQPIVGLVGSTRPLSFERGYLERRVLHEQLQQELVGLSLNSDLALFGGYLGDEEALGAVVGDVAVNTDDFPGVLFSAPGFAYVGSADHDKRLVALVDQLQQKQTLAPLRASTPEFRQRLQRYWMARNVYLEAGVGVTADPDPLRMLQRVGEPLLDIVAISADFSPAYTPLLQMAVQLLRSEPEVGLSLLLKLREQAPTRPEAEMLLQQLRAKS